MKLHARNMAVSAGATEDEVDSVVELARAEGRITAEAIENALKQVRGE
jgi:hydroxymethylglutaryl-CoA reductase